jgi:adenylate kinase
MSNKLYTFIFFGIVGSGKGTQIELLQKYLKEKDPEIDFVKASPGIKYRELISDKTYTGTIVKESLEKGYLQPDFLTNGLVVSSLAFNMKENSCILADGFPRKIAQCQLLEELVAYYGRTHIDIINIELGKEEATKRMKLRGRADDTDEGIAQRFDEYFNNVIPAMNYFKEKPGYTIHNINGEQSIEAVNKDVIAALGI